MIQEIIDALEYSMHMYPSIEGLMEARLDDKKMLYVMPSIDHHEFNRVGMTRMTEEEVEASVDEIKNIYISNNLTAVGWLDSPQSKPDNLGKILEKHGFIMHTNFEGMVYPIEKGFEADVNPAFTYKLISMDDANDEIKVMIADAYGAPRAMGDLIVTMFKGMSAVTRVNFYVAYSDDKPVAFGSLIQVPNTKIGLLNGAATLPDYRGRGAYIGFLKHRFDKAKEEGLTHLIIQGNAGTSAPIAKKRGFEKLCDLPLYVWINKLGS